MLRFNTELLYSSLKSRKNSLGISWKEVAREIGVSESTIRNTKKGGRMEVDGMLAMVHWLGLPVEAFVHNAK